MRDDVDYHYPAEYRWNTVGAMSRVLARAGFSSVEFRMWDLPRLYTPYLPTPVVGGCVVVESGRVPAGAAEADGQPDVQGDLVICQLRLQSP